MNIGDLEISGFLREIWVVFAMEWDRSGMPIMLAAYDGADAEQSANALSALIVQSGCSRNVIVDKVPLWPLLKVSP